MELLKLWNISQKIALTTTILFCLDENKVILLQGTCNLDEALIFLNYNWFPLCKPEILTNYKSKPENFISYCIQLTQSNPQFFHSEITRCASFE